MKKETKKGGPKGGRVRDKDLEPERFKRDLPVPLKSLEVERKKDRGFAILAEAKKERALQKAAGKKHGDRIKELNKELARLEEEVNSGKEVRPVECARRKNYRETAVEVVRLDTMEVVEATPMTAKDRETVFPSVARHSGAPRALPAPAPEGQADADAQAEGDAMEDSART